MAFVRTVTAATFVASLLASGLATAQTAQELWPVGDDANEWTYVVEGRLNDGQKLDLRIDGRTGGWVYIAGQAEFFGTGWGDRWWWMSGVSGRIWTWNWQSANYSQVFHLGLPEGGTFTSSVLDENACTDGVVWEIAERAASVDTEVGTLEDCVVIDAAAPVCADAGLTRMTFCPGVGLVEYGWSTIAGPSTARLIRAVVDGKTWEPVEDDALGGLAVRLQTSDYTYALLENHQPPIPPSGPKQIPDTLTARFQLANESDEKLSFHYVSGQEYDFVIRDDSGNEVYRWSANKFFTMALHQKTVAPGKALSWTESFELRDLNGEPLPPGSYTLEATHAGGPERATTSFRIDEQLVY